MPSPVGHILAGGAIYLAETNSKSRSSLLLAVALVGSVAPDFDFLPGIVIGNMRAFHHGVSHSLAFAILFGALTFLIALRLHPGSAVEVSVLAGIAYASHVLLDLVNVNVGTRGVPIFWPLSHQELGVNLQVFGHFRYSDIRNGINSVAYWENVSALLREVAVLGSLVATLLLKRRIADRSGG